jgi:hypothetical protein
MRAHALKIRGTSLHVIRIGRVRSEDRNHSTNLRWAWESDPSTSSSTKQEALLSPRIMDVMLRVWR